MVEILRRLGSNDQVDGIVTSDPSSECGVPPTNTFPEGDWRELPDAADGNPRFIPPQITKAAERFKREAERV